MSEAMMLRAVILISQLTIIVLGMTLANYVAVGAAVVVAVLTIIGMCRETEFDQGGKLQQ